MIPQLLVSEASTATFAPNAPGRHEAAMPPAHATVKEPPAHDEDPWRASRHDEVTGLANRALLLKRAARAMRAARIGRRQLAVMAVDIDDFKGINASLGQEVGDWYLRQCARRVQANVHLGHTVARIGGNEFAVLLDGVRDRAQAAALARRVLDALAQPACFGNETIVATSSAGLGFFPDDGADEHTLLGRASIAMACAKAEGGRGLRIYDAAMANRSVRIFTLGQKLHGALGSDQLHLHYQPIVRLDGMRVHSMEGLMRWTQPDGTSISPADFIPIAEQTGMIHRLGDQTLRAACAQIGAWRGAGLCTVPVAVNLSPRQLARPDFVDGVFGALEDTGIGPECIELEITESLAMADDEDALPKLQRLADRGVRLAIDDFGTGYSSLSRLRKLPVQVLKIDRSFTRELQHDAQQVAVVAAIVALARALGLSTIAEGVETHEQLDILGSLGCDLCQGYLISRPVSGSDAQRILATQQRD
jgi:diguanylate cyclase (GGDEF)-like protein